MEYVYVRMGSLVKIVQFKVVSTIVQVMDLVWMVNVYVKICTMA